MADKKKFTWDNESKTGKIIHQDGSKDYVHKAILSDDIIVDKADGSRTRTYKNLLGEYVTYEEKKSDKKIAKELEERYKEDTKPKVEPTLYGNSHLSQSVKQSDLESIKIAEIKPELYWKYAYFACRQLGENQIAQDGAGYWTLLSETETDENNLYEREDRYTIFLTDVGTVYTSRVRYMWSKTNYSQAFPASTDYTAEEITEKHIKLIENLFVKHNLQQPSQVFSKLDETTIDRMYDWEKVKEKQSKYSVGQNNQSKKAKSNTNGKSPALPIACILYLVSIIYSIANAIVNFNYILALQGPQIAVSITFVSFLRLIIPCAVMVLLFMKKRNIYLFFALLLTYAQTYISSLSNHYISHKASVFYLGLSIAVFVVILPFLIDIFFDVNGKYNRKLSDVWFIPGIATAVLSLAKFFAVETMGMMLQFSLPVMLIPTVLETAITLALFRWITKPNK